MSSGDDVRLARFVTNLYYGALQRDPTSQELQDKVNQLAAAGAQSQSQLLTVASQIARSLFTSTGYETTPYRSDAQYVADLYTAYLQRGPDDGGLGWWTGQVPGSGRANVCNAFEGSSEFATLVATLYGTATSDNERTEHYVNNFYLGAYGRNATSTELQQQRDALNAAAAQGPSQVQAQAESFGRSLFAAQVNDAGISNSQFVTNLYEAFLQRGPDAGGLGWWSGQASVGSGRQNVLNAFATCGPFYELAGTLYREAFWLVSDRLGTPRMIVNKSGSLAGVKRHDYLPFGEEIGGPQVALLGGRTTAQGYTGDSVRQHFTGYEADSETGLNFAQARYQSSVQGRFTSVDPLGASATVLNPQSFNRYTYVLNDPTNLTDPNGMEPYRGADQSWGDVSAGFWGSGYMGGNGWGNDPRPGQNIIQTRFQSDARYTVRWRWNQYYDEDQDIEITRGWWEKAWESPERPAPAFESGRVYWCKRPTNINGPFRVVNKIAYHFWIKTDQKEAGLGPAGGGVPGQEAPPDIPYFSFTSITDHTGQSEKPNATCELVPDADSQIANSELQIGKPMGRFTATNNCYVFSLNVIEKARKSHEKFVREFMRKPHRK